MPVVFLLALAILLGHAVSQADDNSPNKRPSASGQPPASQEPSPAQQAIEVMRAEIAIDSLNPQLHYELANALSETENKDGALLHYDKALLLKPDFKEALVNKGAVLNEMGFVTDAIASFEKALALTPHDTKALVNLGNSFYALQRYDEAVKQYELSVEADSTFGEGYYYIGVAFADAGIFREAVREWEKIIQVAPNSEAAKTARENIDTVKKFLSSETQPRNKPTTE